jgi:DNA (cytosine-5)-methyltransferase 1
MTLVLVGRRRSASSQILVACGSISLERAFGVPASVSRRAEGALVSELSCLEICAGAGGQSLGLDRAGFVHSAAVEIDRDACETLELNRCDWNVVNKDVHLFEGFNYRGVDLLAGGVPCPPFSVAGKQLGPDDERDLFPQALRLVDECEPTAIMLENVSGLSTARFAAYRSHILGELHERDYETSWQLVNACNFGVPQLRPRFILVAMKADVYAHFDWPTASVETLTVGKALRDLMAEDGWPGADAWALKANGIGPTLVGGSRKHGGPDLGPTRARQAWLKLGVDGKGLADAPPKATDPIDHIPRLTLQMAAKVQGFPPSWKFSGRKTASYRQIGNAFPPPVAEAVGICIRKAIEAARGASIPRPDLLRAV